jgi:hypothetical protein
MHIDALAQETPEMEAPFGFSGFAVRQVRPFHHRPNTPEDRPLPTTRHFVALRHETPVRLPGTDTLSARQMLPFHTCTAALKLKSLLPTAMQNEALVQETAARLLTVVPADGAAAGTGAASAGPVKTAASIPAATEAMMSLLMFMVPRFQRPGAEECLSCLPSARRTTGPALSG